MTSLQYIRFFEKRLGALSIGGLQFLLSFLSEGRMLMERGGLRIGLLKRMQHHKASPISLIISGNIFDVT